MGWIGLDYPLFALALAVVVGALDLRLRRRHGRGRVPTETWVLLGAVLAAGWALTEGAGRQERHRLQAMVQGFAPTYAMEMTRLGHASVQLDTPPNDPTYLALIEAQIRWQAVNPTIADIYTFRKLPDGTIVLIVDSETDYDGDGRFVGEREMRTPIGEVYNGNYPALERAFNGEACFDSDIVTDRWGTWVSAYEPMYDEHGEVEAVLGLDYSAAEWLARIATARATAIGFVAVICGVLVVAAVLLTGTRNELAQRLAMQAELVRARDEAAAAASARSAFLANMSHEIRTPMTAILGYADLLDDETLSEDDRAAAIGVIRRNGRHLLEIIDDILDLSKIEAGRLPIELADCSPLSVVEEVCSLLRVRAVERGLRLEWELAGAVPRTVRTDARRMKQVLLNLVGNAVKFTHSGSVRVVVSLGTDPDGAHAFRIRVIDTGIGIAPDQLHNLFRPFSQADDSMARRYGGTGLGLVLSRRLAEKLGGMITVESEQGVGSAFTLVLPVTERETADLVERPEDIAELTTPGAHPVRTSPVQLDGRVLLAEDGEDNQRLIAHLLRAAKAEVEIVTDGHAAVRRAIEAAHDGHPFGVVLMDMQLPGLDGYSAASELRRRGYTRPIIAVTAHAMVGDRDRCIKAGCDDYLTKPIDRAMLMETCYAWMTGERARIDPPAQAA